LRKSTVLVRATKDAVLALLAGLCGLYAAGLLPEFLVQDPTSYAIVIDGGSSGSRVHVYSLHVEHGKMPRLKAKEAVGTCQMLFAAS